MSVLHLRVRQAAEDNSDDNASQGLDTHAQIAIGVIVPVVLLIGGLIFFIWRTERRRKNAKTKTDTHHPSRLHDFLRRKDAMRGSRLIEPPNMEHIRPEMDHSHRHELGDTSFMHELEDAGSPIYEIKRPPPTHHSSGRKDSATHHPVELDHNGAPIPRAQTSLHEAPSRPQRYSTAEMATRSAADARRLSTASSKFRRSTIATTRHSTASPHAAPPPAQQSTGWRASLQPNSFLGSFANKRDHRVSRATSSRYSKQEFTMMEPHAARYRGSEDTEVDNDTEADDEGKRSDDSAAISPPVSAISEMDLSRQPSQNLGGGGGGGPHDHQRISAVPSDSPAWMKRLSVQDEVEQKWKGSGELVGPGDHKF